MSVCVNYRAQHGPTSIAHTDLCLLRRRRFHNRWPPQTSPEVCFIVERIIRALAGGGTGLIVVTLRSTIMQSRVPSYVALSNVALGPHSINTGTIVAAVN
jgi:hypothetical protein